MRSVSARNDATKCKACRSSRTALKLSTFAFAKGTSPDLLRDDASLGEFGMGGGHGHDHDDFGGGFGDDDDFDF
jgi:hypothetical protein